MSGLSDYTAGRLLNHLFGKQELAAPAIHVALSRAEPLDDGSGLAEPQQGGYARAATSSDHWTAAGARTIENALPIVFDEAISSWGTVTHFALMDSAVGGNLLAHGPVKPTMPIGSGDTARFAAGDLKIAVT